MSDEKTEENQVFLDAAHISQWKIERERIAEEVRSAEATIATLRADLAKIDGRLKAAMQFVPSLQDWFDIEEEKQMGPEAIALTDAIKKVLVAHGGRSVPREGIKANLPGIGGYKAVRLNANPNYFYTALKRLVDRNEIEEVPEGSFRMKPAK